MNRKTDITSHDHENDQNGVCPTVSASSDIPRLPFRPEEIERLRRLYKIAASFSPTGRLDFSEDEEAAIAENARRLEQFQAKGETVNRFILRFRERDDIEFSLPAHSVRRILTVHRQLVEVPRTEIMKIIEPGNESNRQIIVKTSLFDRASARKKTERFSFGDQQISIKIWKPGNEAGNRDARVIIFSRHERMPEAIALLICVVEFVLARFAKLLTRATSGLALSTQVCPQPMGKLPAIGPLQSLAIAATLVVLSVASLGLLALLNSAPVTPEVRNAALKHASPSPISAGTVTATPGPATGNALIPDSLASRTTAGSTGQSGRGVLQPHSGITPNGASMSAPLTRPGNDVIEIVAEQERLSIQEHIMLTEVFTKVAEKSRPSSATDRWYKPLHITVSAEPYESSFAPSQVLLRINLRGGGGWIPITSPPLSLNALLDEDGSPDRDALEQTCEVIVERLRAARQQGRTTRRGKNRGAATE